MRRFDVPQLLSNLHSADPVERRRATLELLDGVQYALAQADGSERLDLIRHLGELGSRRAVTELCSLLGAVSDAEETAVAEALRQAGAVAIPALCRMLGEGRTNAEDHAVRVLGQIGDGRCAVPLVRALEDWRPHVRATAAEALVALMEKGYTREVRAAISGVSPQDGGDTSPIRMVQERLRAISRERESLPLPAQPPAPDLALLPIAAERGPSPRPQLPQDDGGGPGK